MVRLAKSHAAAAAAQARKKTLKNTSERPTRPSVLALASVTAAYWPKAYRKTATATRTVTPIDARAPATSQSLAASAERAIAIAPLNNSRQSMAAAPGCSSSVETAEASVSTPMCRNCASRSSARPIWSLLFRARKWARARLT